MSGKHAASFWQSTAAMITAIATLVVALVGLAAFLVGQQWLGVVDVEWTPPPGDDSSVDRVVKINEKDIRWGPTEFRLETLMTVNFDGRSLERDGPGPDLYDWGRAEVSSSYGAYLWKSTRPPTGTDCATFLATHGTSAKLRIDEGTTLCVRTDEDRIAVVVFKQRDGEAWLADAKVWEQRVGG